MQFRVGAITHLPDYISRRKAKKRSRLRNKAKLHILWSAHFYSLLELEWSHVGEELKGGQVLAAPQHWSKVKEFRKGGILNLFKFDNNQI